MGPVSHRDPEGWCCERGHYRPERPNPGVPGRGHYRTERPRPGVPGSGHYRPELPRPGVPGQGHYRPRFPGRFPAGWHRRLFILLSNTQQVMWCCSVSPVLFLQWSPSSFVVDGVSYSCAGQFMMAGKARLLKDHRAVVVIMSSPDPSAHKRIGRGVHNFDSAPWDREKQNAVLSGNYAKFTTEPHHETSPFEHCQ